MEQSYKTKIRIAKTGEIRRPKIDVCSEINDEVWKQISGVCDGVEMKWLTYHDEDGDRVMVPFGDSEELRQALAFASRSKKMNTIMLTMHETKEDALRAGVSSVEYGVEDLGPSADRLVALDLRIPLVEARELVRRAREGDEIARRVVVPSRPSLEEFDPKVLIDDGAFETELAARGVPIKKAVHWGVTCDKSDMNPIVGVRYHLPGKDYDLCEAEYDKLSPLDKAPFVAIKEPRHGPCCAAPLASDHHRSTPCSQQHQQQHQREQPPPQDQQQENGTQTNEADGEREQADDFTVVESGYFRCDEEDDDIVTVQNPDVPPIVDSSRSKAVSLLNAMGFYDQDECNRLLDRHSSVEEVVEKLVQTGRINH